MFARLVFGACNQIISSSVCLACSIQSTAADEGRNSGVIALILDVLKRTCEYFILSSILQF
jgi:hypothetical protein